MTTNDERWLEVGAAIEDRISELRMTKAEVLRSSGLSDKTLTGYLAGRPIVRADKERGLCEALNWPPDAIQRILRGLAPIPDGDPPPAGPEAALDAGELYGFAALDGRDLDDDEKNAVIAFIRTYRNQRRRD